jgi:phage gp45-like
MDPYVRALEVRVAALERHISRLERQHRQHMTFARSTLPPDDTGTVQTIQGQLDALSFRDGIPMVMHYGFSSAMPVGGDKIVLFGNGEKSNAVAIASNHQAHRFTGLLTGESVLYDMWGHSVRLTQSAVLVIGDLHVTGKIITTDNVSVTGDISATGTITANTINAPNGHVGP